MNDVYKLINEALQLEVSELTQFHTPMHAYYLRRRLLAERDW
jgi:hypothetical protein